jgi:hypothetical protein
MHVEKIRDIKATRHIGVYKSHSFWLKHRVA